MSAVAMTCWPQQMLATSAEGRGRLATVGPLEGGEVQALDLCALAREALARLSTLGQVEPAEVQLELPAEPVFARVNPRRMEQVMLHLIANAVSMRRGEERSARAVRLSVEPQDDFGDYGPTIQMRYVGQGGAASRSEAATAMGLMLARELVESQGGQLAVRHHGHTGTTITVTVAPPDQGSASW